MTCCRHAHKEPDAHAPARASSPNPDNTFLPLNPDGLSSQLHSSGHVHQQWHTIHKKPRMHRSTHPVDDRSRKLCGGAAHAVVYGGRHGRVAYSSAGVLGGNTARLIEQVARRCAHFLYACACVCVCRDGCTWPCIRLAFDYATSAQLAASKQFKRNLSQRPCRGGEGDLQRTQH